MRRPSPTRRSTPSPSPPPSPRTWPPAGRASPSASTTWSILFGPCSPSGLTLVEGAGGWRVPLNEDEDLAGLAGRLGLPVILVVGLKLGCLNHARLTAEAIVADGQPLAGWVGNLLDPAFASDRELYRDNLATLTHRLPGPCLGVVPRLAARSPRALAEAAADHLVLPDVD